MTAVASNKLRRGFPLEKLGSGEATSTERANSAQFIRLLRNCRLGKAKGETPIKKYSNIIPDAV